jgi:DMSO/TMAO reductase YedYZ molybdopterin-dependent catalytic subunit
MKRRLFVASLSASGLVACGPVKERLTSSLHGVLEGAQVLNHAVIGTRGSARLYADGDIDANFRVNGLDTPSDTRYADAAHGNFGAYRLPIEGLVERPHTFTLAELRAMPLQTHPTTAPQCVYAFQPNSVTRARSGSAKSNSPQPFQRPAKAATGKTKATNGTAASSV